MGEKKTTEQKVDIGDITIVMDSSMGKYGIYASSIESEWCTEVYEFIDRNTAEDVFDLLVSIVVAITVKKSNS
jgi:hypothetical protein